MSESEKPTFLGKVKQTIDLVRALQRAKGGAETGDRGKAIFLIGAGCSRTAGIPMADGVAKDCVLQLTNTYFNHEKEITDPKEALKRLCDGSLVLDSKWIEGIKEGGEPKWSELYGEIFENHIVAPPEQREIIVKAIEKGKDKINWAHVCLGELVCHGFIHTVLTTNFDQLVLQGIINTGLLPVVADGLESLNRVNSNPTMSQVVHLHGSVHTYSLTNSNTAVQQPGHDFRVGGMIHSLMQVCNLLVVIGYAGEEGGIMKRLQESAEAFPDIVIYWAMHEEDPDLLSAQAIKLLNTGQNKFVITNCDADRFFADIVEELGLGVPDWIENPTGSLQKRSKSLSIPKDAYIQTKIKDYQDGIEKLDKFWKEKMATKAISNKIVTLRLENKIIEALELSKTVTNKDNYAQWKLEAEIAYEAGQQSSDINLNIKYLLDSKSAWQKAIELNPSEFEVQLGLAKTLHLLSDFNEEETQYIEDAVKKYRTALAEPSFKENDRDLWATTQNDFAKAIQNLNEFEENPDPELVEEAVNALRAAVGVFDEDRNPFDLAETKGNLGGTLQILGELRDDPALMQESIDVLESVLNIYDPSRFPREWAEIQKNLGWSLQKLGEKTKDESLLEKAVLAYRKALEIFNTGDNWADTMRNLASALFKIGGLQGSVRHLEETETIYKNILKTKVDEVLEDIINEDLKSVREKLIELKPKNDSS
jgi:tetratricopeptide (TPR) repeat protein